MYIHAYACIYLHTVCVCTPFRIVFVYVIILSRMQARTYTQANVNLKCNKGSDSLFLQVLSLTAISETPRRANFKGKQAPNSLSWFT